MSGIAQPDEAADRSDVESRPTEDPESPPSPRLSDPSESTSESTQPSTNAPPVVDQPEVTVAPPVADEPEVSVAPPVPDEPDLPPVVDEPEQAQAEPVPAEPAPAEPEPGPVTKQAAPEGSSHLPPPPRQAPRPEPSAPGRVVEGVVTAVTADAVDLLLDDGRPAVISRRNFGLNNEEPTDVLSVGDRAFGAELAREDPRNRVVLSRVWALKRQAWEKLQQQANQGEVVRCRVVSTSKRGVVVDAGVRGFVPASHLELEPVTTFDSYVGETLDLKILEIDPSREKLVLSRRAILQKTQRKERQELMTGLKVGDVRRGKVQSLAKYGAFVDIGGVSGLVHLSELSWYRVGSPSDVVSVGDDVDVKILDVKVKRRRISLSIRQTKPDPLTAIEIGSIMVGKVSRLVDFGAFVVIEGFEGLVHLSELAEYRVSTPEAVVTPGDEVRVKVLSVDPSRRRIELSIRRAAEYQG